MCAKFKVDYDYDEDLLYIYSPASRTKGSVEFAELVLDLGRKGTVTGLELFNASSYLSSLTGRRVTKAGLAALSSASFSVSESKGMLLIHISLPGYPVPANIAVQSTSYSSPSLAYAARA